MRIPAALAAFSLAACTATGTPPAPTAAPTATRTPSPRSPLAYVPDLAPRARHTLVAAGGVVYLLDDAGRVLSKQWMPGGGQPSFRLGSDGAVYVVVRHEEEPHDLWTYAGGRFSRTASPGGYFPLRAESGGVVYRAGTDSIVRDLPRSRAKRWTLPDLGGYAPGAKSGRHGDDGPYQEPLLVVTIDGEPVVVHAMLGRCAVTDLAGGRQGVLDAPAPYFLRLCGDAVVDRDGNVAVLARDGGDYVTGRRDAIALVTVDPVTLAERRRVVLRGERQGVGTDFPGRLVALPGGLAGLVSGIGDTWFVADLRGARPVLHRLPDLGYEVTAAGPDAIFVWGDGNTVSRVTVSTGLVERDVLRLPGYVSGVLRVP